MRYIDDEDFREPGREHFDAHLKDALGFLEQALDVPEYESRFRELEQAVEAIEYVLKTERFPQ